MGILQHMKYEANICGAVVAQLRRARGLTQDELRLRCLETGGAQWPTEAIGRYRLVILVILGDEAGRSTAC